MRLLRIGTLGVLGLTLLATSAQAGWGVRIGIGIPVYGPGWGYPYYYRPYPVYVQPAPVIVQQAPVYQPVYQQVPSYAPPASPPPVAPPPPLDERDGEVSRLLARLTEPSEQTRADVAMQLGRTRSSRAVDPLAATLSGDSSPMVREAAARALGLIGSPRALPALQRAVQVDSSREVRNSAQFSIEVVQAR